MKKLALLFAIGLFSLHAHATEQKFSVGAAQVTPTGGTADSLADLLSKQKEFNLGPYLTFNTVKVFDATASGTTLTSPTASFAASDVGKQAVLYNGGTSYFRGTVSGVTDANTLTLSGSATAGCSGSCTFAYGTDQKTNLDAGLAAASALRPAIADPYYKVKAVIPIATNGMSLALSTAVTVPDGVELSNETPVVNLASSVNTYVLTFGVSGIGNVLLDAAAGSGVNLAATGSMRNFRIGNLTVQNAGFSGPWALKCASTGYSIFVDGNLNLGQGSYSADFSSCDDIHVGGKIIAAGSNRGLIFNGSQDVQIDASMDTVGTYALKGDALRNFRGAINSFANNTNSDWTAGILLGATSTTPSTGVMLDFLAENAQGASKPIVSMDYTSGSWLKILEAPAGSGTNFSTLLTYGANNTGTNYVEAVTNTALTPFTGTDDGHIHITNIVGSTKYEYGGIAYPSAVVTPSSGIYKTSFPGAGTYTLVSTQNRSWAYPEVFRDTTPTLGLAFRASTAGVGSSCTVALYDNRGSGGCPGNLVASTSTIATDSLNTDYYLAYTSAYTPVPGRLYWKAIKCAWSTTAPTLYAPSETRAGMNALMGSSNLGGASGRDNTTMGQGFYAASVASYPSWDASFGSCTRLESVAGGHLTPKF